jgi:uncharacterized membrane protein
MFGLTAFLLITVGTTISSIYGDFSIYVDSHFLQPAILMVAIGAILMLVSVVGCIGALKESTMIINIFAILLGLIFILEMAAAISAYMLQSQIDEMLSRTMHQSLIDYEKNSYVTEGVDFLQSRLECCGIHEPNDWEGILGRTENNRTIVPDTCCRIFNPDNNQICQQYHELGCMDRLHFVIAQSATLIASGALTVGFVQLLGVICAFMLAKSIRRTKSIREARRWQLHQSLGIMSNPFSNKGVETTGRQYNPNPDYTQMQKSEKLNEPATYLPTSPSVI